MRTHASGSVVGSDVSPGSRSPSEAALSPSPSPPRTPSAAKQVSASSATNPLPKRASADASAEAESLSSTSLTKVTSAARRANGGADASCAQWSNARAASPDAGCFRAYGPSTLLHIQSHVLQSSTRESSVAQNTSAASRRAGKRSRSETSTTSASREALASFETDVETDVFAPRDVPPSDASVKSDDRSSSSVHRFENTSFVVPATSRRSRTSASSPSRREGARGGKRWSAAEGSGSTSSCVRAGGAAGRGERGAGKAGRVARRARGKGAGQHMNRRGRRGRRRRARTSNMIIPASLSSQYSERMSSKAAWYFATPHPEEEATAAGSPLSPSRVWHACITASRHDSLSFPRHRPQFPTVCSNHTRVVSFADRTSTRCTSSRRQAPDSRAETDMLGRAPKTDRWERTFLDTSALNSSGFSKCRTFARISEKRVSPLSSPHTPRHVSGALRLDFVGRR